MTAEELLASIAAGNLDFTAIRLAGEDLAGVHLRQTHPEFFTSKLSDLFRDRDPSMQRPMHRLGLTGSVFAESTLLGSRMVRLRLEGADLRNADARLANFGGTDLRNADLSGGDFQHAAFRHCNLGGANLTDASFDHADFTAANLESCTIQGTSFIGAQFRLPSFGSATFSYCDFSQAKFHGVDFRSAIFQDCVFADTLFDKTYFDNAIVTGCDFARSHFVSPRISSTKVLHSTFSHASFAKARWNTCHLENVSLANAALSSATFTQCKLLRTSLAGTTLSACSFDDCAISSPDLVGTSFSDLDLTAFLQCSPRRLGTCSFDYSSIARTVAAHPAGPFHSQPHQQLNDFLENCGIPNLAAIYVVDAARSLTRKELWSLMQSTFISYGSPDENFASRLAADLSRSGVPTFFFPIDAEFGEKLHVTMRKINDYDRTILICSRESLVRSGVQYELEKVIEREAREGGTSLLIPVAIDGYLFSEWQPERQGLRQEVLNRVVADFRNIDDYRAQFNRLLKALRKPAARPDV